MTGELEANIEERLCRIETALERLQGAVRDEQVGERDQPRQSVPLSRRAALTAGGVLGLLGLTGTAAGGTPSGQIGTADSPLSILYAETAHVSELNGSLVEAEDPVTGLTSDSTPGTVPIRDTDGAIAAGAASADDHVVTRGQDVTWSGQHEFDGITAVSGAPIVESDSNDDGEWTRWADGRQLVFSNDSYDTSSGRLTEEGSPRRWNRPFPRSFSTMADLTVNPSVMGDGGGYDTTSSAPHAANVTTDGFDWSIHEESNSLLWASYTAYGRWDPS